MKAARSAVVVAALTPVCLGCTPGGPVQAPLVRIGEERLAMASPEDDALWQVLDVATDRAGTLWALTASPPFVHAFERSGTRVAQFGRKGDGPGDLRFPQALWPDDTPKGVTVWDPGLARAASFLPTSELVASRSLPMGGSVRTNLDDVSFGAPFRARREPDGAVLMAHYDARVDHADQLWHGRLARVRPTAAEPETVVHFARDLPGGTTRSGSPVRFLGPVPLWDACPDRRTAVLDPVSRTLYLFPPSSPTSAKPDRDSIALPWEPGPLSAQERLNYIRHQMQIETRGEDVAESEIDALAAQAARHTEELFPAEAPLAVDVLCGSGRAWLQEFNGAAHPVGYGPVWRTVSLDGGAGTRFARVAFPAGFAPRRILESHALGTLANSVGLERLALAELPDLD